MRKRKVGGLHADKEMTRRHIGTLAEDERVAERHASSAPRPVPAASTAGGSTEQVVALQRVAGNQAVTTLIQTTRMGGSSAIVQLMMGRKRGNSEITPADDDSKESESNRRKPSVEMAKLIPREREYLPRGKKDDAASLSSRLRLPSGRRRTRAATRLQDEKGFDFSLVAQEMLANQPPTVHPESGEALWDGHRASLAFTKETITAVLGNTLQQTDEKGRTTYRCATCGHYFPRKRDASRAEITAGQFISIDHIEEMSVRLSTLLPKRFVHNGYWWEAILKEDALAVYNDKSNLQAMCQSCNSGKSGQKGIDPSPPKRLERA